MINTITINGYRAIISLDPERGMLRGEFIELNGGADFHADSLPALVAEGERSLGVFLEVCRENGLEPRRHFSGKFQVRLSETLHAEAVAAAAARGISLNQFVADAVAHETAAEA
ncbi:MAG: type II toxin-antitoxin system HicB family antitoxin [Luteimonas sp.]